MVLIFCIVSSGSVTNFFPTVVETLNYGKIETLLLTAPPYALAVLTTFLNAWHADRTGERYFHITIPLYVSVAAFIIAAATTSTAPRYLSMMLMVPGMYSGYVVALGWISNTLPRPPAKRAAALAAINAVSNTSSIYASYMYPQSAGPRYGMFHLFFRSFFSFFLQLPFSVLFAYVSKSVPVLCTMSNRAVHSRLSSSPCSEMTRAQRWRDSALSSALAGLVPMSRLYGAEHHHLLSFVNHHIATLSNL